MGITKIKTYTELSLEVGKTYKTKILDWTFIVTENPYEKVLLKDEDGKRVLDENNEPIWIDRLKNVLKGQYNNEVNISHIGSDRIIKERYESGEVEVCDCCGAAIDGSFKSKKLII